MKHFLLLPLFALLLFSCGSKKDAQKSEIKIDLNDAVVQQIINIRSKRSKEGKAYVDALRTYLTVDNPSHRYMAALVLASIQDSTVINDLADALQDPYNEVRRMAAFALGQTKNMKAAKLLSEAFRQDSVRFVQAAILEAVGRCGTEKELKNLCAAQPYPIQDTLLQEGLALALYRFALRKMAIQEGHAKIMNDFISNAVMPKSARFVAANYLARVSDLDLSTYENVLINNVLAEKNTDILMFLVIGLAKTKTVQALKTLEQTYFRNNDYKIKCQVIRSLPYFEYDSAKTIALNALKDYNYHLKNCAADYLILKGKDKDAESYFDLSEKQTHWQIKSKLLAAALKNTAQFNVQKKGLYSNKILERYKKSENDYEKAELLQALSYFSWNYRTIYQLCFNNQDTVPCPLHLQSTATQALINLYNSPVFDLELNLSANKVRSDLHGLFIEIMKKGDPGCLAIIAEGITQNSKLEQAFKDQIPFLKSLQNKLKLPEDNETCIFLQNAMNKISDKKENPPLDNKFVEIDWSYLNALGDKPRVTIKTSKGTIVAELYPTEAPATVYQFLQLIRSGYYNKKFFHRVVPNFVVQTGCKRGDGWSGHSPTVVSEFSPLRYNVAGRLGMASAGKDTESAQFFITHAPAIHLDGNYTIFGQVIEGLDVVHKIELGDQIELVELNN